MRLSPFLSVLMLSWASTVFAQPNMPSGMGNPPYNQGVCNPNGNNPYAEEVCGYLPSVLETYTADCTKDSGAFKRTLGRIGLANEGTIFVQIVGDCEVDPHLIFADRHILISGWDESGHCSGRLVNRDSARFRITAADGALVRFSCLQLDVMAEAVDLYASLNSFFALIGVTAPPLQISTNFNSSFFLARNNAFIGSISGAEQSRVVTWGMDFWEGGALLRANDGSDFKIYGGSGVIASLILDNGSSADLQSYSFGPTLYFPPDVDQAFISFDSRLRSSSPVLDLTIDESSVAITPEF